MTAFPMGGEAATAPTLGTAASYSVLANTTVTNTGATTLSGNMGIYAGSGVAPHYTGFPPGVVTPPSVIHDADASALLAQSDNTSAFGELDQTCDTTYSGNQNLTLVSPLGPGVYCAVSFSLSGNLTLSGSGAWIFKSSETLITSPGSSVTGADPCSVWWRVGSSATLDVGTSFRGSILALASISLNTGASINGRLLVQTGAVTLQSNIISGPTCVTLPTNTPTSTAEPGSTNTATPTNTPPLASTNTATPTNSSTQTAPQLPGSTNTATAIRTSTSTSITQALNTATAPRTSTRTPMVQAELFSTSTVIPTSTPIVTATPQSDLPAGVVTTTTPMTPVTSTGTGSPPQSTISEIPQTGAASTTQAGRPPQLPIFLPPSVGDGGLSRPVTTKTSSTRVVLAIVLSLASGLLIFKRLKA